MTVRIDRLALDDRSATEAFVTIVNAVTPESPTSEAQLRWADANYPGGTRFLALDAGRPVGTSSAGRIYMYAPTYERYWFEVQVLPDVRRRGIGTELWRAASGVARAAGKTGLQTSLSETQADGLAFLEHRGFEVVERNKMVRLELRGRAAPEVVAPPGFELTSLAARPELAAGMHQVALEAFADVPASDEPFSAGTLEEFLARDVDRDGIPLDGLMVAVESVSGRVAGWASLLMVPGSTTVAWHDMTAVGRAYRGRGVATALKRGTIRWAIEHGLEALDTGNDESNAPMRAVNRTLGYRPIPDELMVRGPLAPG